MPSARLHLKSLSKACGSAPSNEAHSRSFIGVSPDFPATVTAKIENLSFQDTGIRGKIAWGGILLILHADPGGGAAVTKESYYARNHSATGQPDRAISKENGPDPGRPGGKALYLYPSGLPMGARRRTGCGHFACPGQCPACHHRPTIWHSQRPTYGHPPTAGGSVPGHPPGAAF